MKESNRFKSKAQCPVCNNSIYKGGITYHDKLFHLTCADKAKRRMR